jgi:hypothetical protein
VTLKDGVERTLMEQLPELTGIRDKTDHSVTETEPPLWSQLPSTATNRAPLKERFGTSDDPGR